MGKTRDINQLIRVLRDQGARVERARCGHWKVTNTSTGRTAQIPATPKNDRAVLNAVTRLRRIGLLPRTERSKPQELSPGR
jgi:hypothetical protein